MDEKNILQAIQSLSDKIDSNQQETNAKIEAMENRMDGLENRMDGLENRMDGLENQIKETQRAVIELGVRVENKLEKSVRLILENQVEILKQKPRVDQIQGKVEEHDSDIKMIKNVVADHSQKLQKLG